MGKTKITPEMGIYIRDNYLKKSQNDISKDLGISIGCVIRYLKKNGLKVPKELTIQFRREKVKGLTKLSEEQIKVIKRDYLIKPVKRLALELNTDYGCVMRILKNAGLEIPKELREKRKKEGMYRKGHAPYNKGRKVEEYLTPEQIEHLKKTSFKKGNIPATAKKDWEETTRKDKRGVPYIFIKIPNNNKMVYKHIWIWEKENGKKLPERHNIIFKDGNTLNLSVENLECVSDAELMGRNSIHNYPPELKKTIQLSNKIKRKIRDHGKHNGIKQ